MHLVLLLCKIITRTICPVNYKTNSNNQGWDLITSAGRMKCWIFKLLCNAWKKLKKQNSVLRIVYLWSFIRRESHGRVGFTEMWRTPRVCRTICTAWLWCHWPSLTPQWTGTGASFTHRKYKDGLHCTPTHSWCPKALYVGLLYLFTHSPCTEFYGLVWC